jgi:hypothetical protein
LEAQVSRAGLPERAVPALLYAATGGRLRRPFYADQAEVSDDVATRDLKACADAGILLPHGERRGRYYTANPEVRRQWAEIRVDLRDGMNIDPFRETQLPLAVQE